LRDRGTTVFFSSHILADAEAVCSRVAILAGGRLATAGRLSDLLAIGARGWEVVVDQGEDATLDRLRTMANRVTRIAERRYMLELPLECRPERALADLTALGTSVVSISPLRDTLEDYFMRRVSEHGHKRRIEE
jgi:ABC-2 type transport system ATP-binding protein